MKMAKCNWCDPDDMNQYDCHKCHEGMDIEGEDFKSIYKEDYGNNYHETWMWMCPKCDTEYYKSSHMNDTGAGGEEWKVLNDGTRIDKYQPRLEGHENQPLRCNY